MAFDAEPAPTAAALPGRSLSVAPHAGGWAVKHGDGFLGLTRTREEAQRLLDALQAPQSGALARPAA